MKPVHTLQEQLLIIRIRQFADQGAFAELYEHFADKIFRFIYFKVNDKELAQDLTAEVFLRIWKQLRDPKVSIERIRPFLFVTARNLVIDHYRSKAKMPQVDLEQAGEVSEPADLRERFSIQEDAQFILQVIKRLKQSYQEILLLRHVEELSLKEIASVIDKTPVAARVLLHRANHALKREYEKIASHN